MVVIRRFEDADRQPLRDLFDHAGDSSAVEQLWGHADSEAAVYLLPYIEREPESLLLADDGGRLVGYLTGCRDSAQFPSESERMDQAITEHKLLFRPRTLAFFLRSLGDLAVSRVRREEKISGEFADPRWPAHLHIAVVEEYRGKGVAEQLMGTWLRLLDEEGVRGCYLQTLVENVRAVRFFERMGFTPHGATPAVPGARYQGGRVHLKTMVRG